MSNIAIAPPADRIFSGILLTSIAYALFAGQDAAIKLLVAGISVWQVMFFRSVVILLGCLVFGGPSIVRDTVRSPIVNAMVVRSLFILGAWLCYYSAAKHLQLAEMTTIYFAAPVVVTILSIVYLGEVVPFSRWIAVGMGFVGVFIACDPTGLGFTLPVMLVLAAAVLWACSIILIRRTALQERTIIQVVLNNAFFLVMAGVPTVFFWSTPTQGEFLLLVAVGGIGGIAQFTLFEGMKRAPASVIASFEYTSLVWAFVLGYLIWSDVPRPEVFVGAAMIIGAGFVIITTERARRRR